MSNEIYKMPDHSVITLNLSENIQILRVPGGWIYTAYSETGTGGYSQSSCFVPFDNEFMEAE